MKHLVFATSKPSSRDGDGRVKSWYGNTYLWLSWQCLPWSVSSSRPPLHFQAHTVKWAPDNLLLPWSNNRTQDFEQLLVFYQHLHAEIMRNIESLHWLRSIFNFKRTNHPWTRIPNWISSSVRFYLSHPDKSLNQIRTFHLFDPDRHYYHLSIWKIKTAEYNKDRIINEILKLTTW